MKKGIMIILAGILVCAILAVGGFALGGTMSKTQIGTETTYDKSYGDLLVSPIIEANGAPQDRVEAARKQIEENFDDITVLCEDLKQFADINDYAVLDIIDVCWGEITQGIVDENGFVEVEFETELARNSSIHSMFLKQDGDKWECYDEFMEVLKNGNVKVKLSEQGVIVFFVK